MNASDHPPRASSSGAASSSSGAAPQPFASFFWARSPVPAPRSPVHAPRSAHVAARASPHGRRGVSREEAAAASLAASRSLLRQVIRQVHPDRFARWPEARARNADALKRLNAFVDTIRSHGRVSPLSLHFSVQRGLDLESVTVELPRSGSLAPLYAAFGLDAGDAAGADAAASGCGHAGALDVSLLDWLAETVRDAVRTSEEHNLLKTAIRDKSAGVARAHALGGVSLAVSEFAIATSEQKKQLEALCVLERALGDLDAGARARLEGLRIVAHQRPSHECGASHVATDGCLRIIVGDDAGEVASFLSSADTKRARACQRVATYWRERGRSVAPRLAELLRVKAVMGEHEWTGDVSGARDFALFAGRMLEAHELFASELAGRAFNYSILVHSDCSSGVVEYTDRSCVVQVRNDSDPEDIIDFQTSGDCEAVERQVRDERTLRREETEVLDRVREALSAKTVISLCSPREHDLVLDAGRRLLAAAPEIREAVDLTGACICIDDCYDAWDNGYVSLPYDFSVGDVAPALIRLLSTGAKKKRAAADAPGGGGAFSVPGGPVRRDAVAQGLPSPLARAGARGRRRPRTAPARPGASRRAPRRLARGGL